MELGSYACAPNMDLVLEHLEWVSLLPTLHRSVKRQNHGITIWDDTGVQLSAHLSKNPRNDWDWATTPAPKHGELVHWASLPSDSSQMCETSKLRDYYMRHLETAPPGNSLTVTNSQEVRFHIFSSSVRYSDDISHMYRC